MRNEYNFGVQADQMGYPFVSVFEEALPHTFCQEMIQKFEANEDQVQVKTDYEDLRHFTEINISQHGKLQDHESMWRCLPRTHCICVLRSIEKGRVVSIKFTNI